MSWNVLKSDNYTRQVLNLTFPLVTLAAWLPWYARPCLRGAHVCLNSAITGDHHWRVSMSDRFSNCQFTGRKQAHLTLMQTPLMPVSKNGRKDSEADVQAKNSPKSHLALLTARQNCSQILKANIRWEDNEVRFPMSRVKNYENLSELIGFRNFGEKPAGEWDELPRGIYIYQHNHSPRTYI